MSNFPNALDDDSVIPAVNDNITEIGGLVVNALRDSTFAIQENIGLVAQGSTSSISERLGVSLFPDGTIKASALTGLGLVTLPITEDQISASAEIPESKLKLDHRTQDLFNYILDLSGDVNQALGWISATGVKLEPHLVGQIYKHSLSHINVSTVSSDFLSNNLRLFRNNSNSYELIKDMNAELLAHQWADGSDFGPDTFIITNNGSTYSSHYGHTASGIFLNTSGFSTIPQTATDLQEFAEFIDGASIFLLGSRLQNLYSNGISRESRSSSLLADGYGTLIIPPIPAIAYLKNIGNNSSPFDDINSGDDIIELEPPQAQLDNNSFDEKFALVNVGDIIRINYGTVEASFIIKERKYIENGGNKQFVVRIAGKNLQYTPNASVQINRPLVNTNKYGVLALAAANSNVSIIPSSLIVASPRSAQTLGIGFNANQFDNSHYLLYLALYPTGIPDDGYVILPGIDVTGNQGATPGAYTLNSIVENTNNQFRKIGYNYRFIAYQYEGEFGIALADSYNNAAFSILNAVVASNGTLDPVGTGVTFPNNVVGMFASVNFTAPDPLGFGPLGANVASPAYQGSYPSAEAAISPTKLFLPLRRNSYYVNGTEREKLNTDVNQTIDSFGDGYWVGTIVAQTIIPGTPGTVQTTYRIPFDLSASQLKKGKTIVVQSSDGYGNFPNDFGRFIIADVALGCCSPSEYTDIKVHDAVHGLANSGTSGLALGIGGEVAIYFSSDSVAFNSESATDFSSVSPFKRHFETYIDENSNSFTHERGRFNAGNVSPLNINDNIPLVNYSELVKMDLVKISPKLRGYQFGSVTKLTLSMISFDNTTGIYDGYLGSWDGNVLNAITNKGPITSGKKGEITRFYDETNIDYIDIIFDLNTTVSNFSNQKIDIQLFPTLSLDNQVMLIGTFQYNDVSNIINWVRDERQFGNTSEKEFSTSALNFISLPERVLHGNGVVRGFDLEDTGSAPNPNNGQIYLTGGEALINGKFIQLNNETVVIPLVKESPSSNINWALCVNSIGEYQPIPLLDYDPTLNTPNNLTRVFTAVNLLNGQTYNIDASSFSDIINNRKDLTILYIVASITTLGVGLTPPSITLDITDARKYINDGDTNFPLRLTAGNAQGNFKNPVAILNWIKYNNVFNGTAIVKGADITSGVIDVAIDLDFDNKVTIEGENNALLTFTEEVTLGSNLTFSNLNLNFTGGISLGATVSNLSFENCVVDITISSLTPSVDNVIFDFVTSNNIVIKDSTFNIIYNPLIPTPSPLTDLLQYGSVFRLTNTTNFIVDNSTVDVTFSVNPGTYVPGDIFILITSDGVIIKDSNFSGNFNRCVANSGSNNLQFKNCIVTSTFNPDLTSPDFGFDSTDLVNSGQGYIYSNVDATLNNIIIDSCTFNYSPAGVPTSNPDLGHRFSFINFELTNNNSILSDLLINNCKFNHTNIGGETDDNRAAIAIINTCSISGIPTLASAQQPLLINANIIKNTCNRNQTIVVTSRLNADGYMVYPGLAAINCNIKENVCGVIGYWISSGTKIVNISPDINVFSDKTTGLTIKDNTCHDITNVNSEGLYFLASDLSSGTSLNKCFYPSGYVTIDNNKCNWIHVSITYEESSSLNIINNSLTAYDLDYLVYQVGDDTPNTVGFSNQYAIFVHTNKYESNSITSPKNSNDVSVHIMNNTIGAGYWHQSNMVASNYRYGRGFIFSTASSIISGNNCRGATGIEESENENHLILIGGTNNIVNNNIIYREELDCTSYVGFNNYDNPIWDGSDLGLNSKTIIVDNFFDSPYVSNSTLLDIEYDVDGNMLGVINLPADVLRGAIVERNKNQTGIALIPLTNHFAAYRIGGGGDVSSFGPATINTTTTNSLTAAQMSDLSTTAVFNGSYRSQVLRLYDTATADFRMFGFQESIEKFIPQNVRLVTLRAGIRGFGTTVDYTIGTLTITAATNASPIAITTSTNHGLLTGTKVTITGVTGNTAANGVFTITSTGLTTFTLTGTTGSGVYAGGGTVYPDVGATTSNFWLNVSKIDPYLTSTTDVTNLDYFSSFSGKDTSIAELDAPVYSLVTGGQINSTSASLPFFIDFENYNSTDISYNYMTGRGSSITLSADFRWERTGPEFDAAVSPIEIKYRW